MTTMTGPLTIDSLAAELHEAACGFACDHPQSHELEYASAAAAMMHAAPAVRAAAFHAAVCGPACPAPHEHAARLAARAGL